MEILNLNKKNYNATNKKNVFKSLIGEITNPKIDSEYMKRNQNKNEILKIEQFSSNKIKNPLKIINEIEKITNGNEKIIDKTYHNNQNYLSKKSNLLKNNININMTEKKNSMNFNSNMNNYNKKGINNIFQNEK
jgi:hypothetical protein